MREGAAAESDARAALAETTAARAAADPARVGLADKEAVEVGDRLLLSVLRPSTGYAVQHGHLATSLITMTKMGAGGVE